MPGMWRGTPQPAQRQKGDFRTSLQNGKEPEVEILTEPDKGWFVKMVKWIYKSGICKSMDLLFKIFSKGASLRILKK